MFYTNFNVMFHTFVIDPKLTNKILIYRVLEISNDCPYPMVYYRILSFLIIHQQKCSFWVWLIKS